MESYMWGRNFSVCQPWDEAALDLLALAADVMSGSPQGSALQCCHSVSELAALSQLTHSN
jgi:hypothetical protein